MRPRPPTPTRLRALLPAGVVAVLLVASCLNPQPDDFPQSAASTVPNERSATQAPAEVEVAPGDGATTTAPAPLAPPILDLGNDEAPPPADSAPEDAPAFAGPDADAGAPGDAGPPDAAPAVVQ